MQKNKDQKEWLAIVNPNAGKGKGIMDWDRISWIFEKNNIAVFPEFTRRRGHATELVRNWIASGYRQILAVGGDGTLNEIVNGVFTQGSCKSTEITVGMIPVGTGNDWGRMFGIPLIYEGSVKVIKEHKTMLHDVGVITFSNGNGSEKRYFINISGLGFEAAVVKKTNAQKAKGRSSNAIYFWNLLTSLLAYRNREAEITIDGRKIKCNVFSVNVGNGRYCGGGMRQTPEAVPDDGLLDVTVIKSMGKLEIIRNLKLLYDGTILSHPKVDGYRTNYLEVNSEYLLYAEADGESLGHTPVQFSIIPAGINIVYNTRTIQ